MSVSNALISLIQGSRKKKSQQKSTRSFQYVFGASEKSSSSGMEGINAAEDTPSQESVIHMFNPCIRLELTTDLLRR